MATTIKQNKAKSISQLEEYKGPIQGDELLVISKLSATAEEPERLESNKYKVKTLMLDVKSGLSTEIHDAVSADISSEFVKISTELDCKLSAVSTDLSTTLSGQFSTLSTDLSVKFDTLSTGLSSHVSSWEETAESAIIPLKKIMGLSTLNYYTYIGDDISKVSAELSAVSAEMMWFDTRDEPDYNAVYNLERINNLQYQIYRMGLQVQDLWKVVDTGAVPGNVTNNHKDSLITLADILRMPKCFVSSDVLSQIYVYGPTQLQNNSRYYVAFNPAGFDSSKNNISCSFVDHDPGIITKKTMTCVSSYWNPSTGHYIPVPNVSCTLVLSAEDGPKLTAEPSAQSTPIFDMRMSAVILSNDVVICADCQDTIDLAVYQLSVHDMAEVDISVGIDYANEEYGPIELEFPYETRLTQGDAIPKQYTLSVCGHNVASADSLTYYYALLNETNLYDLPLNTNLFWYFLSTDLSGEVHKVHSQLIEKYDPSQPSKHFAQIDILNPNDVVTQVSMVPSTGMPLSDLQSLSTTLYVESRYDTSVSGSMVLKLGGSYPSPTSRVEPTVKAVCAKNDTSVNFSMKKDSLINGELLYFKDTQQIAVWDADRQAFVIPAGSGSGVTPEQLQEVELSYLTFKDQEKVTGRKYQLDVDCDGNVKTRAKSSVILSPNTTDTSQSTSWGTYGGKGSHLIGIGKVFCGGNSDSQYNQVSHNFVELTNATDDEISLDNMYLCYRTSEPGNAYKIATTGHYWEFLPLNGTIKPGKTFVVRGSECNSYRNSFIKVDKYDMLWRKKLASDSDTMRSGDLISFSQLDSTIFLCIGYENVLKFISQNATPWNEDETKNVGYIDLFGVGAQSFTEKNTPLSIGTRQMKNLLFVKWFYLDPSKQAHKAVSKRTTQAMWTYVDLTRQEEHVGGITQYYMNDVLKSKQKPQAIADKGEFFTNKTTFAADKPNMMIVTFGCQATETISCADAVVHDNVEYWTLDTDKAVSAIAASCAYKDDFTLASTSTEAKYTTDKAFVEYVRNCDASRCFNWVSKGNYDEYLEYRPKGTDTWIREYSIDAYTADPDGRLSAFHDFYDRYRWTASDGSLVTTHKVILHGCLSAGDYEWRVGRKDDHSYYSDPYEFHVHDDVQVLRFSFVQTSDQQGFNWIEYQAWKSSCYAIKKFIPDFKFTMNTGDITQSGNRVSEWLDYYDGRQYISDKEEMFTIGNNDLCGNPDCELTNGDDNTSKYNLINIKRYFTFELDPRNVDSQGRPNCYAYINVLTKSSTGMFVFDENPTKFPIYSMYSFTYGCWHFQSVVSEIGINYYKAFDLLTNDNSAAGDMFSGTDFAEQMNARVESWFLKDCKLFKDPATNYSDCVVYMHEMPFTMVTFEFVAKPSTARSKGCKLNDYNSNGTFRFSRLFRKLGIKLVMGGHKHTYTLSKCIYDAPAEYDVPDNVNYPISNDVEMLKDPFLSVSIDASAKLSRKPYVETTDQSVIDQQDPAALSSTLFRYKKVSEYSAPTYLMTQATGYKLVSNKELPTSLIQTYPFDLSGAAQIPWLISYFNSTFDSSGSPYSTENINQHRPTFSVVTLDAQDKQLSAAVYQVDGVYYNDKDNTTMFYDINNQYLTNIYLNNSKDAGTHSVVGLSVTQMTFERHATEQPTAIADPNHAPHSHYDGGYEDCINGQTYIISCNF